VLWGAVVHDVCAAGRRADRSPGEPHRVRDAGRGGAGAGVASQPGAPVLRVCGLERRCGGAGGAAAGGRLAGAGRWAIEVAIFDAKNITGAGEARNRVRKAVERTVPFALFTQSIVIIWYHLAGHSPAIARDRRDRAPWYATKTCPAYTDMITKLRRVPIAAQFHPGWPASPPPKKSAPSTWPGPRQRPDRESREIVSLALNRKRVLTWYP
jgi:hypothetical protein